VEDLGTWPEIIKVANKKSRREGELIGEEQLKEKGEQ